MSGSPDRSYDALATNWPAFELKKLNSRLNTLAAMLSELEEYEDSPD
jgi:hypothetical protein